jgi:hypothetical protein
MVVVVERPRSRGDVRKSCSASPIWKKKAPAGEDRQALPARKLVRAQPVQLGREH